MFAELFEKDKNYCVVTTVTSNQFVDQMKIDLCLRFCLKRKLRRDKAPSDM